MNIEETLEILEPLYPITGAIHVGVGGPHNLSLYKNLGVEKLLLIEANQTRCEIIKKHIPEDKDWKIINQVVADIEGEALYYELNNKNESGLIPPEKLKPIWPNIKLVEERTKTVTMLDFLVEQQSSGNFFEETNLLVIDCFSSLSILEGAKNLLSGIDLLILRGLADDFKEVEFCSYDKQKIDEIINENSFVEFLNKKETHPFLKQSLFLKDDKSNRFAKIKSLQKNPEKKHSILKNKQRKPINQAGLKRLHSLNLDTTKRCIYLDVKSLPRSGLHYMKRSLKHTLGSNFSFCEWYNEPGCCKKFPCDLTCFFEQKEGVHVRLIKSHDFDLNDPIYSTQKSIRRIILIRDPLFILTSWWVLEMLSLNSTLLKSHGINLGKIFYLHESPILKKAYSVINRDGQIHDEYALEEWLNNKKTYINGFINKWCNPYSPVGQIVAYEWIKEEIIKILGPLEIAMDEKAKNSLEEYRTSRIDAFKPRKDAFSGRVEKLTNFLTDHSAAFQRTVEDIKSSDHSGCLTALRATSFAKNNDLNVIKSKEFQLHHQRSWVANND